MLHHLKKKSFPICSVLTSVAFVLWLFSSLQARSSLNGDMSKLGLFSILPASFFVAFSLLVISFFVTLYWINKNWLSLIVCQTLLLIFFLNLTPAIIENTARFNAGYSIFRSVDYISETAKITPTGHWALNWPSFSALMNIFVQITSILGQTLLLIYPTFFNILLLLPLFAFFRVLSNNNKIVWVSIWFVFFGNWVSQDYFSMQSIGFFSIALLLFLSFKNMNQGLRIRQWVVVFLLISFYLASSHLLSSLAILCALFVLTLTKHLPRYALFLVCLSSIVSWTIFNAHSYFSGNINHLFAQILDFMQIFQRNVATRISGSAAHVLVTQVRMTYSVAIIAIAVLGFVLICKNKRVGAVDKQVLLVLAGFSFLLCSFAYGGEMFQRVYLFSLLPLAYFACRGLKNRFIFCLFFIFFVVFAPSLHVIAHYGNETMNYVPHSEIIGVNFLYDKTAAGHVVGGLSLSGDFRDLNYHQNYSYTSFRNIYLNNSSGDLWIKARELHTDRFVCISYATNACFSFFYGDSMFLQDIYSNLTKATNYGLLYSNPSFVVYYSAAENNP
ncbi:MAG: hypothetical protein NWE94_03260 [Candidatus Bathyarchaeota archaeon]|nr:hypothetical protein [Candidatus Bathyarchaeota archaeon]